MIEKNLKDEDQEKPSTTVPGTVEKIIKPPDPKQPEQAEIVLEDGEPLYREIRIENTLTKKSGEKVALKQGAPVDLTVEADEEDTVDKDGKS